MSCKPKGLTGWIKKNTKEKEQQTLRYKDDPIKKRQYLASKLCEIRSNLQKMENQHQKYLTEIILNNQIQQNQQKPKEEVYYLIVSKDIQQKNVNLFSLAKGDCQCQLVIINQQTTLQKINHQIQQQKQQQQQQQQQQPSVQVTNDCITMMQCQKIDYGIKPQFLTQERIQQFKDYEINKTMPTKYLTGFNKNFTEVLKIIERNN